MQSNSIEPETAFNHALTTGQLSPDPVSPIYHGVYIFISSDSLTLYFKHMSKRDYLLVSHSLTINKAV